MKKVKLFWLLACLGLAWACSSSHYINLEYPPHQVAKGGPGSGKSLLLVPFEDLRKNLYLLGSFQESAYRTAEFLTKDDVGKWIMDSLERDMKDSGFLVKRVPSLPETPEALVLTGKIHRVEYGKPFIGPRFALIEMSFQLLDTQKRVVFDRKYIKEDEAGLFQGYGSTPKQFTTCLQQLSDNLLKDIGEVIAKY
jgi:hypothetical protein